MAATIEASIEGRGCGFPAKGDYVQGDDGALYLVVDEGSRIEIPDIPGPDSGTDDVCLGYTLTPVAWDACEEDEQHQSLALVRRETIGE